MGDRLRDLGFGETFPVLCTHPFQSYLLILLYFRKVGDENSREKKSYTKRSALEMFVVRFTQ
jgi:hypothetical protein